jgi:DNA polymerase I
MASFGLAVASPSGARATVTWSGASSRPANCAGGGALHARLAPVRAPSGDPDLAIPLPETPSRHWLAGCDATPGIVSVAADASGRARVWRRLDEQRVELTEHRFPNWFLTTSLDLVAHLPARRMSTQELRCAHRAAALDLGGDGMRIVELQGGVLRQAQDERGVYRYLVLADTLAEVEPALLDAWNKQTSAEHARSLAELGGLVAIWPPVEQFLLLTGRTYFKGLQYADLRRLQFDLETTGLDEHKDHIFMVSLHDSTGWRECLDTGSMSEAALIERFVRLVQERDPDVLENHNIFAFDLPFLVRRATSLGVRLALGRDGSEPRPTADVLRTGERGEPFTRWTITGREVIDTLHTVKRHGAATRELRRHGLKEAARHFGIARADREYVPGAEIWATFQRDPERIRRYACDDVEEVDGLSRRLMGAPFRLASLVPRAYERLATDATPQGVLEPLLVRAYLHEGRALPGPAKRAPARGASHGGRARSFLTGVVRNVVRVAVPALPSHVVVAHAIRPHADELSALPALLREFHVQRDGVELGGLEQLAQACRAYLASPGLLFADPEAAAELDRRCREVLDGLVAELERHGATPVAVDGERVLFGVPEHWTEDDERALLDHMERWLPDGIRPQRDGRYQAIYAHEERSHILLGYDGTVSVVGSGFHASRQERFGERFIRQAAPLVLMGDAAGLRRLFLETVSSLRAHEVPLEDLCAQATLRKSSAEYRRDGQSREPYEVLLGAGVKTWRSGQRIRYFRDRAGSNRLLREGDGTLASEADAEHYVERLKAIYCQLFAQAFSPADFRQIFRVPAGPELFDLDEVGSPLAGIRPIARRVLHRE